MTTSLISTKLYIPHPQLNVVLRPRLTDRLLSGLVTPGAWALLSGPAGFGKTTLLAEFIARCDQPVAWLSIDAADNDPLRFWTYFISACQVVLPGVGGAALVLSQSPQPLPADAIPTALINDLGAHDRDLVLVLDDYHLIQNQVIHSAVSFLLDHAPERLHLIFSTRIDPPWPLARYRSRGRLIELRAADLRFTNGEAADFLNQSMGLALSPHDIASLEARTEGWIAGLQLAALSMRGRTDVSGFVKAFSGSHAFVADYLVEEVLQHQTEEMQAFLLRTSILERMTGGSCDALTGRTDGQAALSTLLRANLFILPLDDQALWFRYHHLFADLLRARLQQTVSPAQILALHQRAARWYQAAGMPVEAIGHALQSDDRALAVRLVEDAGLPMILQGYVRTVEAWLGDISPETAGQSSKIQMVFVWLDLLRGPAQQASPHLEALASYFASSKSGKDDPALYGEWLAIQAKVLNLHGKPVECQEMCRRALDVLPAGAFNVRSMALLDLAMAYQFLQDDERAAETFQEVARNARAAGDQTVEILGLSGQARMLLQAGRLQHAFEVASAGIERVETSGWSTPFSATLYGEIGTIHFERHQFDQARTYFRRSAESSGHSGYSDPEIYYHLMQARMLAMEGQPAAATLEMHKAGDLIRAVPPAMIREGILNQQVRVHLAADHLPAAEGILTAEGFSFDGAPHFPGLSDGTPFTQPAGLLYVSALRFLLVSARSGSVRGGKKKIIALATLVLDAALGCHLLTIAIETLLLRSQLQAVFGADESSLADVVRALDLAEPEGFVSMFVEEGQPIQTALAELASRKQVGTARKAYLQHILAAFLPEDPQAVPGSHSAPGAGSKKDRLVPDEAPVKPLTARELEVLKLITAGDSNQTIAEKLVITVSAVKKHSGNIFSKLNVNSRTQAVARARHLGLLPATR